MIIGTKHIHISQKKCRCMLEKCSFIIRIKVQKKGSKKPKIKKKKEKNWE